MEEVEIGAMLVGVTWPYGYKTYHLINSDGVHSLCGRYVLPRAYRRTKDAYPKGHLCHRCAVSFKKEEAKGGSL